MKHKFKYYYRKFGINGLLCAIRSKMTKSALLLPVARPDIRHKFFLRCYTSDVNTYHQVFVWKEYDFIAEENPKTIVDAGANIGLASIFLANRYPDARIIAIEPEKSNYEMLAMNTAPYPNITTVHAALWDKDEEIELVDPGYGKWGFMTRGGGSSGEVTGDLCHKVKAMTVDSIMESFGLEKIDILKIDIEGAEREVFQCSSSWLPKVDSMIVELHDRMKPGCNRSFYHGSNGFESEWTMGENVYLSRHNLLTRKG